MGEISFFPIFLSLGFPVSRDKWRGGGRNEIEDGDKLEVDWLVGENKAVKG